MDNYMAMSIWTIGGTLSMSIFLIRKNFHPRPMKFFIALYILGQALGYGAGVDILKVVVPTEDGGITHQLLTSTALPLAIVLIIDLIYITKGSTDE